MTGTLPFPARQTHAVRPSIFAQSTASTLIPCSSNNSMRFGIGSLPRLQYVYPHEGGWVLHLLLQGIDNRKKWEPMEVRVAGTNPADAMLTHEHCNVQIVEYVSVNLFTLMRRCRASSFKRVCVSSDRRTVRVAIVHSSVISVPGVTTRNPVCQLTQVCRVVDQTAADFGPGKTATRMFRDSGQAVVQFPDAHYMGLKPRPPCVQQRAVPPSASSIHAPTHRAARRPWLRKQPPRQAPER